MLAYLLTTQRVEVKIPRLRDASVGLGRERRERDWQARVFKSRPLASEVKLTNGQSVLLRLHTFSRQALQLLLLLG